MKLRIALIPGDGIGPDIIKEAVAVLDKVAIMYGHEVEYEYVSAGGVSLDEFNKPLQDNAIEICNSCDAVLLGAVGGPKWDDYPSELRPEKALLALRGGLGLFCNLRPAVLYPQLKAACPLKDEVIESGLDIMVVRELTGGIYFGKRGGDGNSAFDTLQYSVEEIRRIALMAFEIAKKRNGKVTSIDKANILTSSQLWRKVVNEVGRDYPEVELSHLYVDNAAMQLIRKPSQFDVILTGNMFGDILSDEASMLTGSIGMLPSASLRTDKFGMYEPIHGSAPDIQGMDMANPIATILSLSMMLRYTFSLNEEADIIENAVKAVLDQGYRTPDLYTPGDKEVGTMKMGALIRENLRRKNEK